MTFDEEVQKRRKELLEEKEREDRLETFYMELKVSGFDLSVYEAWRARRSSLEPTYPDRNPSVTLGAPILRTPPPKLGKILEEAKPYMTYTVPVRLFQFSDGTTRCRQTQADEQPDAYAFREFKKVVTILVLENGSVAAFSHGYNATRLYESEEIRNNGTYLIDYSNDLDSWDDIKWMEFRQKLIERFAAHSLSS